MKKAKSQSGKIYEIHPVNVQSSNIKTTGFIAVSQETNGIQCHEGGAWIFPTENLAIYQIKKWR